MDDLYFMGEAIAEAQLAAEIDEVPVGAVVVRDDEIIARAHNLRETEKNALCHAETMAVNAACKALGGWRLPRCTLYVTLEPCPMCAGAIVNSRIERVVFGAYDKRAGAFGSVLDLNAYPLNHKPEIVGGVMEEECRTMLQEFFKKKR
ncbi:MAG: tRNA adenosine(34) deaminase TadA [Clostridia bacterium]|nr:tRNA adenosine(34) deaminase TadA [Clostridia bacterium]